MKHGLGECKGVSVWGSFSPLARAVFARSEARHICFANVDFEVIENTTIRSEHLPKQPSGKTPILILSHEALSCKTGH
jgi:hypothetical protein